MSVKQPSNVAAAVFASKVLNQWKPRAILMVGIAAAASEQQNLGDLVIGESVVYCGSGKITSEGVLPEPKYCDSDSKLLNQAKAIPSKQKIEVLVERPDKDQTKLPKVEFGVIASVDAVIADASARDKIVAANRKIRAIEMESYGFIRAIRENDTQVKCLMIRSLCDYADTNKGDRWRRYAAAASASFTQYFLLEKPLIPQTEKTIRNKNRVSLIYAGLTTIFLLGTRFFGLLMPWELWFFDFFMNSRLLEDRDDRLRLIEITDNDLTEQRKESGNFSLSDRTLLQILQFLAQDEHKPRVLGLDILRPANEQRMSLDAEQTQKLDAALRQSEQLITICQLPTLDEFKNKVNEGVAPPSKDLVPPERIGFMDFIDDQWISLSNHSDSESLNDYGIIRRQRLLIKSPVEAQCTSQASFSLLIANKYLESEDIKYEPPVKRKGSELYPGRHVKFLPVTEFTGGYQGIRDADEFQILLNYRHLKDFKSVVDKKTLSEFLEGISEYDNRQKPVTSIQDLDNETKSWTKDKIVLVGLTAARDEEKNDYSRTPYGEQPGVIIHAHMISQILSAVLDGRPLLRVFPQYVEIGWIVVWSTAGGVLGFYSQTFFKKTAVIVAIFLGSLSILFLICWVYLEFHAVWIPFVPPALGFITSGCIIGYCRYLILSES